jgi:hypothetical protein
MDMSKGCKTKECQIAAATIEGTRKRGRPRKRWKEEVEEDLNKMGIKKWACGGQGLSEMEEDCIASQDPQWTVVLQKKKNKKYLN